MKIIQIYEKEICTNQEPDEETTTAANWTDTAFDPDDRGVRLLVLAHGRRYRLIEVLGEADGVALREAAKGDEASLTHHEAAA